MADNLFVRDGVDLRKLARAIRSVPWLVMFGMMSLCFPAVIGPIAIKINPLIDLCVFAIMRMIVIVWIMRLMFLLRTNLLIILLAPAVLWIPFVDFLVLFVETMRGLRLLESHGVGIRQFGLADNAVVDVLMHPTCQNCGYDLTGNTIGVCPECGTNCTWRRTE